MDLILEGRFVTPGGVVSGQIGIEDGLIKTVKKTGLRGKTIRTKGLIFPGFIDPHVHLREPGWTHKEDFLTGSLAALHGGVTTVLDMPNNKKPTDTAKRLKEKIKLARKKALIDVLFYGMVTGGNAKELLAMKRYAAGYKVYMSETTGTRGVDKEELQRIASKIPKGELISFHCEDQWMVEEDKSRPPEAETTAIADAMSIANRFRLTANVCHLSTAAGFDAINDSRRKIYCEVTPMHAYFYKNDVRKKPLLTMNPPLRERKDRDFLLRALIEGKIDFLATDHAPHTIEEKKDGARGCPGLDTYGSFVTLLLKKGARPETILRLTSLNIARVLKLKKGLIKEGYAADLTVLETRKSVTIVREELRTKCSWSPFEGVEFPGRVEMVVRGGLA